MELDPEFLDEYDVTCVVTCIGGRFAKHRVDSELLQGLRLPEKRIQHINFCPNFAPDRQWLRRLIGDVSKHSSVLIHCKMGQKRSVMTASAIGVATGLHKDIDDLERHLSQEGRWLDEDEWDVFQMLVDQVR